MIFTIYALTAPGTKHLISHLQRLLSETIKKFMILLKKVLLYNFTEISCPKHIILSKIASLILLSIFQLRNQFLSYNISTLLNEEFFLIKTKFKYLKKSPLILNFS